MEFNMRDLPVATRRVATVTVTLLIIAGLITGCSNSAGPGNDDEAQADRTTTQGVIDLLAEAYNGRDATAFASCLAADFVFYLEPSTIGSDPTLPSYWGKTAELELHEIAFGTRFPVTSLSLTLEEERAPLEIPGPAPSDPSEWEFYQRYTIETVVEGTTYEVNGYASFQLAGVAGDTSAQGDQLWSIVEWTDTGEVPCRVDATNWTEIKLLFAEDPDDYVLPDSPTDVIEKFRQAYVAMDAIAVLDCFSDTFSFWLNPNDVNDPGNQLPESWDLADESTITWNMFGPDTDIIHISLTLTQLGDPVELPAPGGGDPGWAYVYDVDMFVYLPHQLTLWANAAARFELFVDPDEIGPAGETLWEIARWHDIDDPARVEESSWGSIKAMYRESRGERVEESTWGGIKALYR